MYVRIFNFRGLHLPRQGKPYVRRELEMPVAALHHAGISYSKLQEMEVALVQDVVHEVRLNSISSSTTTIILARR